MALPRGTTNTDGPPLSIKIPTKFIQSIGGNLPKNVTLRDGSNNLWEVKVEMEGGHWYLKDGLTEFINENKVEAGELLVYQYFSHGIFDFKVHDRSTCQTKGVGVITRVQQVMADGDQCIPSNMEEGQRLDYFEAEEVTDSDDEPNGEEGCFRSTDDDGVHAQEVDQEAATVLQKNQKRTRRGKARDGGGSCSTKKGKRDLDWFGEELFISGVAQQPKNPYFVTKLMKRKNRAYELFVPGEFIKLYNLDLPEAIVFVDEKERRFPASRKKWADGRTLYHGDGWKDLCAANSVEDEDAIICEILPQLGTHFCIRVTFVPPPKPQQP